MRRNRKNFKGPGSVADREVGEYHMRRSTILALIGMLFLQPLPAQTAWEGTVFWAEPGQLPDSGLYAAANDFPRATFLEVTLPRTGRTVTVEVLKRNVEGIEGPVLALSAQAARELGLEPGESATARATVSTTLRAIGSTLAQERRFSPDPEVDPRALSTAPRRETPLPLTTLPQERPPVAAQTRPGEGGEPLTGPSVPATEPRPLVTDPEGPRTVSPQLPAEQPTRSPVTLRPGFVTGTEEPVQIATPPEQPPKQPRVTQAREQPLPDPAADFPRSSPAPTRPPAERQPLVIAPPPERPRASPPTPRPEPLAFHPDAPAAPREELDPRPRALSPQAILPRDEAGLVVMGAPPERAIVSPSPRLPEDPKVALLPPLPEIPRIVQPVVPSAPSVADLPAMEERPRLVERHPIPEPGMVEIPSLEERPRTVQRQQPPQQLIVELPLLEDTPRVVQPNLPRPEVADRPVLEESPRTVERVPPPLGEIADLPQVGEAPRTVVSTLPRERPESHLEPPRPQPTPSVSEPDPRPPATTPRAGLESLRYVSRPQKPEGDIVGDIAVVERLDPSGYYVQLGTFRSEETLFRTLNRVRTYVPLVVQQTSRGLRLLAGPVTEGQVGLLLRHYQGQGFRDAFVVRPAR